MNNDILRAAVLAAIAGAVSTTVSTPASAAAYTIHVSGASAQRTFWEKDLQGIVSGIFGTTHDDATANGATANNVLCTTIATSATLNPAVPDLHSMTCFMPGPAGGTGPTYRYPSTITIPTGVTTGDTITMNYEAEFGSVWGIAPFLTSTIVGGSGSQAVINGGRRSVTCAGVTGYSRDLDTASACLTASPAKVDIGVSDAEPIFWALPDNWPVSDGVTSNAPNGTGPNNIINVLSIPTQGQPTLAQLQALEKTWQAINGEVFTVVTSTGAGSTTGLTNLSTQSLRAIFTGQWSDWSQVPEAAGNPAGNIVVCRRDHGSGSQTTSSLYFTQTECGGNNGYNSGGAAAGAPPRFVSTNQAAASLGASSGALVAQAPIEGLPAGAAPTGFSNNPIENFSSGDITACLNAFPGQSIGLRSLAISTAYNTLKIDNVEANAHNAANGAYKYAIATWGVNNTATTQGGVPAVIAAAIFSDAQLVSHGLLPVEGGTFAGGVWTAGASAQVSYALQDIKGNSRPTSAANTSATVVPITIWKQTGSSSCSIPLND
jgi:hypothetical protein